MIVCTAVGVSGSHSVRWALSILARMSRETNAPEAEKEVWVPVAEKFELYDDEKFKRKKFKRPPIYLRRDQPKNKWIVKPTRLDLLKDADDVLEALVQNKVPRNRRFEQRARRKKKGGNCWQGMLNGDPSGAPRSNDIVTYVSPPATRVS